MHIRVYLINQKQTPNILTLKKKTWGNWNKNKH